MRHCVFVLVLAGVLSLGVSASAERPLELWHFELVSVQGERLDGSVPNDCSTWHELWPTYCIMHHQDSYEDDGDGLISPCDYFTLDGVRYHIDWVGPTYHLVALEGSPDEAAAEPVDEPSGGDPTCEYWHWIYPPDIYCTESHVDGWEDGGEPGVLDVCDNVFIDGRWWHIEDIGLNVQAHPEESPVDQSTWGKIKDFFRGLFE